MKIFDEVDNCIGIVVDKNSQKRKWVLRIVLTSLSQFASLLCEEQKIE